MRPSHASAQYLKDAPPLIKAVKKEKFVKGSMVKGRNESATIPHVAYAIAKIKDISVEEVAEAYVFGDSSVKDQTHLLTRSCNRAWTNSIKMFGLGETVE